MESQYRVVVANNIEEFHAKQSRFINHCYQLNSGPFKGKTEILYGANITFTRCSVNCTVVEQGQAPDNLRSFTFHPVGSSYIHNGISFNAGDTSASCTGDAFVSFLRGGCHYYSLMVSDEFAKKMLSDHDWQSYRKITGDQQFITIKGSPKFVFIVDFLDNTLNALADGTIKDSDNKSIQALQQQLLRDIVILIESAIVEPLRSNSNHRLLHKASKIVMDTCLKPLTVDELSKRVGTSRRNLEHIFQSTVGISPKRFIVNVRLNRIREDLCSQNKASVMEVAKHYGIRHLGHFSRAYKDVFKELPSQTRARAAAMALA